MSRKLTILSKLSIYKINKYFYSYELKSAQRCISFSNESSKSLSNSSFSKSLAPFFQKTMQIKFQISPPAEEGTKPKHLTIPCLGKKF